MCQNKPSESSESIAPLRAFPGTSPCVLPVRAFYITLSPIQVRLLQSIRKSDYEAYERAHASVTSAGARFTTDELRIRNRRSPAAL